ncbi:MAG TPA: proline--tRNA ligase [Candidatus Dormibacteraeota bacterium]|nr:proline--tRNA ligase [Candidatus Dormibacteraeota bacterium]
MSDDDRPESGFVKEIRKQSVDFPGWYNDVVRKAQLADYSPVRGCMVIRPYGYSLWENIRDPLDGLIKETGHENWYFPALIPLSFLMKEAEHVEGFQPEFAMVTRGGGKELEEPLVLRPTSETMIASVLRDYIQSYRDLPVLTNQWNNVFRWELRTRLFLRTLEFLWQEGHTFHETAAEAEEEVVRMLEQYRRIAEEWCAVPVLAGRKSDTEKFAGAQYSMSIEGMMVDGKALQMGTSHYFGDNFTRAYDLTFTGRTNERQYPYSTSWGVSTRMVGAVVMAHGDDFGLQLPPRIAPVQVIIIPIFRSDAERTQIESALQPLLMDLDDIRVKVDWRDERPGFKYNEWELKGVPIRIEIGPRDLAKGEVTVVRRLNRVKQQVPLGDLALAVPAMLEEIQVALLTRAREFRETHTGRVDSLEALVKFFDTSIGFAVTPWCGRAEDERTVTDRTKATTRVILPGSVRPGQLCAVCGQPATVEVAWGKAY